MRTIPRCTPHAAERFWAKVDQTDDCWLWRGSINYGYGLFRIGAAVYRAHRVAWTWMRGPIPAGLHLDHTCRERACVRPDHMEPVRPEENTRRGDAPSTRARRDGRCMRGLHAMVGDNVIVSGGKRECRACKRIRMAAWRERNRDRINASWRAWKAARR